MGTSLVDLDGVQSVLTFRWKDGGFHRGLTGNVGIAGFTKESGVSSVEAGGEEREQSHYVPFN